MDHAGPSGPHACDPEKVFGLAEGWLDPEQRRKTREHVALCADCRELYERELDLNARLESFDLSGAHSSPRFVCESVAMALPTRRLGIRILWGSLASLLLAVALVALEPDGTGGVILAVSTLGACWGFVAGSADAVRVILAAASPTILYTLALGALADVLIALATVVLLKRGRRAREA